MAGLMVSGLKPFSIAMVGWLIILHGLWAGPGLGHGSVEMDFPTLRRSGNLIDTMGRGTLRHGPFTLEADNVSIDGDTLLARLQGNVHLWGLGLELQTDGISYHLKKRSGTTGFVRGSLKPSGNVAEARDENEPGLEDRFMGRVAYFQADSIELGLSPEGKPEVVLRDVRLTDCDAHRPHHDIRAAKLRVSIDHRMEAQHIRPSLFGVPYFYMPYLGRDLGRDWPWTRWTLGSKSNWGRYFTFQGLVQEDDNDHWTVGLAARRLRGEAASIQWQRREKGEQRDVAFHAFREHWRLDRHEEAHGSNRARLDWVERRDINSKLKFSLDLHWLSPLERGYWTQGARGRFTDTLYEPPFAGTGVRQRRESLMQDYFEEEFEKGRRLRNRLALDYHHRHHRWRLSSYLPLDREASLSFQRTLGIQGRGLPKELFDSLIFHRYRFDVSHQGQVLGEDLDDADRRALLGNVERDRFTTWRAYSNQRLERPMALGPFVHARPYLGVDSHGSGKVLKPGVVEDLFSSYGHDDIGGQAWAHRLQAGFNLGARLRAHSAGILHRMSPSLSVEYNAPSSFETNRVVAPVDDIDTTLHPRWLVRGVWAGEAVKGRHLFSHRLEALAFPREEDRELWLGADRRGGSDFRAELSTFPFKGWKVFTDLRYNSLVRRLPFIKSGWEVDLDRHAWSYGFTVRKSLRSLTVSSHRHDFSYRFRGEVDDLELKVSWDGEDEETGFKSDDFYDRGFRRFEAVWGRLFHCLRAELALDYEFEDSGATVLFRFGPDLLRDSLPGLRKGIEGL